MCELIQGGSGTPIRLFSYRLSVTTAIWKSWPFGAIIIAIWFTAQSARPLSPQSLSGDGLSAVSLSALLKQTGGRFTFTSHPWFCRRWLTFKDNYLISADERENGFKIRSRELALMNESGGVTPSWRMSEPREHLLQRAHMHKHVHIWKKVNTRGKREVQMMEWWSIRPVHFLLRASLWNPSRPHPGLFSFRARECCGARPCFL